ncbi:hypothetical protein CS006_07380 [Bifidobacterium primatium]|uniref:DUF4192 domain-containing protein n=1 Tax=Bifidobacterium primatium TaxID=2045438 RepID=A0A2M9H8C7_9BIFI|nr:hypothetical protein [Bifidobacterium primatium]PJM73060.1 hypothetical protein CS006_07380 [Bifidobacterium primatium]
MTQHNMQHDRELWELLDRTETGLTPQQCLRLTTLIGESIMSVCHRDAILCKAMDPTLSQRQFMAIIQAPADAKTARIVTDIVTTAYNATTRQIRAIMHGRADDMTAIIMDAAQQALPARAQCLAVIAYLQWMQGLTDEAETAAIMALNIDADITLATTILTAIHHGLHSTRS